MAFTYPLELGLGLIESEQIVKPGTIARRIVNLGPALDEPQTLTNQGQMTPLDPKAGTFSTRIDGLHHCEFYDGASQITYVRSNTTLYRHEGWNRSYTALTTALTYDTSQPFPDSFVTMGGKTAWCNGMDQPLLLEGQATSGRLVQSLGFRSGPGAPFIRGPSQQKGTTTDPASGDEVPLPPNYVGYSIPGKIGTISAYNGEDGNLLDGSWLYYAQFEDAWGNLSPLSPASLPVTLAQASTGYVNPQNTNYTRMNSTDSLTKQFFVTAADLGEDHVAAIRVYRTENTRYQPPVPHLLVRSPGRVKVSYPDNTPDAYLLSAPLPMDVLPAEPYKVACAHQGRLVMANFRTDPTQVRWSEVGRIGTILTSSICNPDRKGQAITGLYSWGDMLLVFTSAAVYGVVIQNGQVAEIKPILDGAGCIAPGSICALPSGRLFWLGQYRAYIFDGERVQDVSFGIRNELQKMNRARASRAVAQLDERTGQLLFAFSMDETLGGDAFCAFDEGNGGWRHIEQGIFPTAFAKADSVRTQHLLVAGYLNGSNYGVWAWNKRSPRSTTSPEARYESVPLSPDPSGQTPFTIREIHVGFVTTDLDPTPSCTFTWYTPKVPLPEVRNDSLALFDQEWDPNYNIQTEVLDDPDVKFVRGLVTWRRIQVIGLRDVKNFRFKLTFPLAQRVQLVGFKFVVAQSGTAASRTPGMARS